MSGGLFWGGGGGEGGVGAGEEVGAPRQAVLWKPSKTAAVSRQLEVLVNCTHEQRPQAIILYVQHDRVC